MGPAPTPTPRAPAAARAPRPSTACFNVSTLCSSAQSSVKSIRHLIPVRLPHIVPAIAHRRLDHGGSFYNERLVRGGGCDGGRCGQGSIVVAVSIHWMPCCTQSLLLINSLPPSMWILVGCFLLSCPNFDMGEVSREERCTLYNVFGKFTFRRSLIEPVVKPQLEHRV